jgi:hypothetical protein
MTPASPTDRVTLVLSPSPVRRMLRDWLRGDGFEVREAAAWEVDAIVADEEAGIVITSDDLDGEWEWTGRHGSPVLVLALPRPSGV